MNTYIFTYKRNKNREFWNECYFFTIWTKTIGRLFNTCVYSALFTSVLTLFLSQTNAPYRFYYDIKFLKPHVESTYITTAILIPI